MSKQDDSEVGRSQSAAIKADIADRCRQLYDRGLIVAGDGNLSVRLNEGVVLVTPTGVEKGRLQPEDVIEVTLDGDLTSAHRLKPSSEFAMHRACYEERPDVRAIVHAHPPHAVALSLVEPFDEQPYLSEVALTLGKVPILPYCVPTTSAIADQVRPAAGDHDAFVLARHGAVALGRTLDEAFGRLETLEHAAKILWLAKQAGSPIPLNMSELAELEKIRKRMNEG